MTPRTLVSFATVSGGALTLPYKESFVTEKALKTGDIVFITPQNNTYLLELDTPSDVEASVAYRIMGIAPTEIEDEHKVKTFIPEVHLARITGTKILQ